MKTEKPLLEVFYPKTGDSREAGIYDVCEWWIATYPEDIFVTEPDQVILARNCMKQILAMRKSK